MTEPEPEVEIQDAYSLLSKPTLEISDAEAEIIIEDLRRRRKSYLATGKPDKPRKEAGPARPKATKDDKAANTAALLAGLNLKMPGEE